MDIRTNIIQNMVNHFSGKIDDSLINTIQDILTIELNNYEIQNRSTEIVVYDNSNEKILKKFVASKRVDGIAESTLKRYIEQIRALLYFLGKPIVEINTYDIRFYFSVKRERDKVCNRTLDGTRRCYNSFFKWVANEGYIAKNPCASIAQIKYKRTIKKPYSAVELEKLRKSCSDIRDLALVEFLYATGCRVSEVSNLNMMDVDFENMQCTVLGKGNKERIVYLTDVASMYLQEYLSTRKHLSDALFIGKKGKRLSKNGIEALLKRLGQKAKVENVHPHRYRRTLATNLLDHGMSIQDVAMILGHADLKTTQVYCYISQKNVSNAYKKYA
ncbi:MAG: tyrosine-type recombinase/integrase [bacterium]|nr:tyrosine-type recombinase/integrase [bacterium]